MACTPGGEARALPLSPFTALAARFSAFSAFCLFLFLVLLAVPFTFFLFFHSPARKKKGGGDCAKLLDHLGRQLGRRAQPSLAIR